MSGRSSSGMVGLDGDLRGMAILPNGLVATMLGARADAEVIKVRRKAAVFMVLKILLRSAVAEWGEARGQGVRRDGGARMRTRMRESVGHSGVVRVCGAGGQRAVWVTGRGCGSGITVRERREVVFVVDRMWQHS